MLNITKRTEYGLMALAFLAERKEYHSVRAIVEALGIPQRLLAEVLKQLSHSKIVEAQRGPTGGYRLKGPANEITLSQVIFALEGPVQVTECHGGACDLELACIIRQGMISVGNSIHSVLQKTTVADLLVREEASETPASFPA